jgi:uncharacterized membrane protein
VGETRENGEKDTARVEAFSDGVFAIAITLLVLELHVPRGLDSSSLRRALLEAWPSYFAFLTSFLTIGIMWLNHHRIFGLLRRVDHTTLILNGLLLLGVSVVPFPTSLVAEYLGHPGERVAVVIYAGVAVYIATAFTLLWRYIASPARRPPLMRMAHDDPAIRSLREQYRFGPAIYVVLLALAWWKATLAMSLCLAMALLFLLPPRRAK